MSIAGDCRLMMAHITSTDEIEKYREQYLIMNDVDLQMQKVIDEAGVDENASGERISRVPALCSSSALRDSLEFSWVSEFTSIIDRNLFASIHAYEYAVNIVSNLGDHEKKRLHLLTKRFGSVRNEMGVYWMNKCAQAVKNLDHEAAKVARQSSLVQAGRFVSLGNQGSLS